MATLTALVATTASPALLAQNVARDVEPSIEEIVVTARLRNETLLSVPVAVTALGREELERYASNSLQTIAQQTPNLQVVRSSIGGGGQITLRGITTSGSQEGFEQAVSVNIDGVQLSRGRIVTQGFFDLKQVEILKGPQALFFGKNSPAGVISLVSAGPGDELEGYVRAAYGQKADEMIGEAAIGGPLSDQFGVRLAVRANETKGWMRNNSVAQPVPFNTPGIQDERPGSRELLDRLTLTYQPNSTFGATLKVMQSRYRDDGPAQLGLQVTPCGTASRPDLVIARMVFLDPTGDCLPDSNTSIGAVSPAATANWPLARSDGQPYSRYDATVASLKADLQLGAATITSVTGYYDAKTRYMDTYDGTTYGIIASSQREQYDVLSQELRLQSDLDGPLNFMMGGYFQSSDLVFENNARIALLPVDAATGKFHSGETLGTTDGTTYSAFAQLRYNILPNLELAGGARWTSEEKDSRLNNTYVHPFLAAFLTRAVFIDPYEEDNVSPEVTLTWRPSDDLTFYSAYKTGFKSGGLGLSSTLTAATTLDQIRYGSEDVKGFEIGAKGRFLDRRLSVDATAYRYVFSDLQVSAFDATAVAFVIKNAGRIPQTGAELQLAFVATPELQLRGAVSYNHNRFDPFFTNCYAGQTAAAGCTLQGQNFGGKAPTLSPDTGLNAGATYEIPIGSWTLGFSGDARYSSSYFAGASQSPLSEQDSFWRYDASIQLLGPARRWELSLIGQNLSDERFLVFSGDKPFTANGQQFATVARPREVMLQATVNF